jgi:hypothetical protein
MGIAGSRSWAAAIMAAELKVVVGIGKSQDHPAVSGMALAGPDLGKTEPVMIDADHLVQTVRRSGDPDLAHR